MNNQLLIVTDLPLWLLQAIETGLKLLAILTGHDVSLGSVRPIGDADEQDA